MTKNRTSLEAAAGKLISSVQKEWGADLGESIAEAGEDVMDKAHELLQAAKAERLPQLLGSRTVAEFLGELWIQRHPSVKAAVSSLEAEIKGSGYV